MDLAAWERACQLTAAAVVGQTADGRAQQHDPLFHNAPNIKMAPASSAYPMMYILPTSIEARKPRILCISMIFHVT
jgi:hypothetical protein